MEEFQRDKKRVDPLTGAEDREQAKPLDSVPEGLPANATTAVIPGTGHVVTDIDGKEVKRVVSG